MPNDVDRWMAKYDNPQKPVVEAVRKVILAADKRIGETIKWQSPTFMYKGNLASFNPKAKQFASLMFHTGAKIEGTLSVADRQRRHRPLHPVRLARRREEEDRRAEAHRQGVVRPARRRLSFARCRCRIRPSSSDQMG